MAKIYIYPQKKLKLKHQWSINLCLSILIFITLGVLSYIIKDYKKQLYKFEELKQNYNKILLSKKIDNSTPVEEKIELEDIDKAMQSRPEHIFFDRIRLSHLTLLQIEGSTNKPEEIEEIVKNSEELKLYLKINQVQLDNDQEILFELKQI